MKRLCYAFCLVAAFLLACPVHGREELKFKNLEGQDLRGRDFLGMDLSMTELGKANLRGVDFSGAELDRTELDGADLSGTKGWAKVDFGIGLSAQGAKFHGADLSQAVVPGTYFERADFSGADLRGAYLSGRFHEAIFTDAKVAGAVLLGAHGIEPQLEDLRSRGAIVDAADFSREVQRGVDFSKRRLRNFNLQGALLDGGRFEEVDFHSAHLDGSSLKGAHLVRARFYFAYLPGAELEAADLSGMSSDRADFSDVNFSRANCAGASFSSARMARANFSGADLTNADFSGADLRGADLSGAILNGVKWDAAILEGVRGLPPGQLKELKSKAARWKFEFAEHFSIFVQHASMPGWLLTLVLGAAALAAFLGDKEQRKHRDWMKFVAILHGFALAPALGFLILDTGGLTIATLLLLLGLFLALPTGLVAAVMSIKQRDGSFAKQVLPYLACTILSLLCGIGVLGSTAAAMG